jgi:hypothetical protein
MKHNRKITSVLISSFVALATLAVPASTAAAKSRPIVCAKGTFYTPISKRCEPIAAQHGNTIKTSTSSVRKSHFNKWRIEKGTFGILEMNGVMATTKNHRIIAPNN